jgi:hypothetical protein
MTNLDSKYQSITLPPASQTNYGLDRRLIVLVPSPELDLSSLTRRIWELANAMRAHVLFLGMYSDPLQELRLRRELATMASMVKDGKVFVQLDVAAGKDWVGAVKASIQAGDMVVCFAEQRTGPLQKPLSQVLQASIDAPLYILSGFYPQKDARPNRLAQAASWMGSILLILGFSMLQIRIIRIATDWNNLALLLTIPFEFWTIWAWNNLFG